MPGSPRIHIDVDFLFGQCFEEGEYVQGIWKLLQRFYVSLMRNFGLEIITLHDPLRCLLFVEL